MTEVKYSKANSCESWMCRVGAGHQTVACKLSVYHSKLVRTITGSLELHVCLENQETEAKTTYWKDFLM